MIEARQIDGDLFIVSRSGRNERLLTPSEAIAEARTAICEAEAALRVVAHKGDELRAKIDEAVLFDEPTADLRTQLAEATRESESLRAAIGARRSAIEKINSAVDNHHATALKRQHANHLASLVAPFDQVLKECQL